MDDSRGRTYNVVVNLDVVLPTLDVHPRLVVGVYPQLLRRRPLLVPVGILGDQLVEVAQVVLVVGVGDPEDFVEPSTMVNEVSLRVVRWGLFSRVTRKKGDHPQTYIREKRETTHLEVRMHALDTILPAIEDEAADGDIRGPHQGTGHDGTRGTGHDGCCWLRVHGEAVSQVGDLEVQVVQVREVQEQQQQQGGGDGDEPAQAAEGEALHRGRGRGLRFCAAWETLTRGRRGGEGESERYIYLLPNTTVRTIRDR